MSEIDGKKKKRLGKEIDIDKIDLDRLKEQTTDQAKSLTVAADRGAVAFTPNQEGAIKSRAYNAMNQQLDMQMENIMEQIHVLARQAEDLKERKRISEIIYTAKIKFEPITGRHYYLYQLEDETAQLSLLAPEDWGEKKLEANKMKYLAKVYLLADHTWRVDHTHVEF